MNYMPVIMLLIGFMLGWICKGDTDENGKNNK